MLHDAAVQFKSSQSLTKKPEINAKTSMLRGKSHPALFSVAPMMDWTDNHYRTLARLISKHAWLYTEMVVAETIIHQKLNLDRFLSFSQEQHPIVLQVGGSNLENLAKAAELANLYSYDEINLNCGCPSGKVAGHGCFGARLMFNPKLVGHAMAAIAANSDVPVSVKCRIGVDDRDSYNELCDFISTISSLSPTNHFIIHARKALLSGLSPAENRKVPPLKYEYYFALLRDFPELHFTLNGGLTCINQVVAAIKQGASGVMIGRAAYNNPWFTLGPVDSAIYGVPCQRSSRRQILEQYQEYADSIIGMYGSNNPNVRQLVKTVKSFLEETLAVFPDHILDSNSVDSPCNEEQFAEVDAILPPPYRLCEQQLAYAEDNRTMLSGYKIDSAEDPKPDHTVLWRIVWSI